MANCGCGAPAQGQTMGCQHGLPVGVTLAATPVDRSKLGVDHTVDPCDTLVAIKATITTGALQQCDPCPRDTSVPKWVWAVLGGLLGLLLLGLLIWSLLSGGSRGPIASVSMVPTTVAQAGQPVSATANPVNYTEINLNGAQLASTGPKLSAKPAKPAVPTKPCNAVVFDPNGSMDRFGVALTVDGTNYVISQINDGRLASPNDIQAAQSAKKEWVTVVLGPSGPYAVNHKGNAIPVMVDKNSGRILVSAAQVSI